MLSEAFMIPFDNYTGADSDYIMIHSSQCNIKFHSYFNLIFTNIITITFLPSLPVKFSSDIIDRVEK